MSSTQQLKQLAPMHACAATTSRDFHHHILMTRLLGTLVQDETISREQSLRAMDNIVWQKTSIGPHEPSHEFTAIAPNGIDVGRIYRIDGGPLQGRWRWIFLLGHSQFRQGIMSGDQASKQRAANQVRKTYERYLETPGCAGGGQSRIPLKKQSNQDQAV